MKMDKLTKRPKYMLQTNPTESQLRQWLPLDILDSSRVFQNFSGAVTLSILWYRPCRAAKPLLASTKNTSSVLVSTQRCNFNTTKPSFVSTICYSISGANPAVCSAATALALRQLGSGISFRWICFEIVSVWDLSRQPAEGNQQ